MFDRVVDILSDASERELENVREALAAQNVFASVRPSIGKGIFARNKWRRTPEAARRYILSVRKRDVAKADYLIGHYRRNQK